MAETKLQVGDSVVVKPGVEDPDLKIDIGGWQGRVSEVGPEDNAICIRWDSLTLRQMPGETIDQCEEEGLDWTVMYLHPDDVKQTVPRDSEDEVEAVIAELETQHNWSFLGEQGKRIQAVLTHVDQDDELATYEAWENHFQQILKFPFEAKVSEWQDRGPLRTGDKVTVIGLEGFEDLYGILVALRRRRDRFVFPLCDLEALDQSSPNYQPLRDYAVWFANR